MPDLEQVYDDYERIEEAFLARLDESLNPREPDYLYKIVGSLGLPRDAKVLDLGCGDGRDAIELARRFGFEVLGVDPVARHIELANEAAPAELRELLRFELGAGEALPLEDASVDLIWCKEVLVLVEEIDRVFEECRRVLRPNGRMLIYQVSPTERMEPGKHGNTSRDLEALRALGGADVRGAWVENLEIAFASAGFTAEQTIALTSEGGEYGEETLGIPGRRLLHAARLLRAPDRYIAEFGQAAYDVMLADCFWHVYRMIGKLSARVYVLRVK